MGCSFILSTSIVKIGIIMTVSFKCNHFWLETYLIQVLVLVRHVERLNLLQTICKIHFPFVNISSHHTSENDRSIEQHSPPCSCHQDLVYWLDSRCSPEFVSPKKSRKTHHNIDSVKCNGIWVNLHKLLLLFRQRTSLFRKDIIPRFHIIPDRQKEFISPRFYYLLNLLHNL